MFHAGVKPTIKLMMNELHGVGAETLLSVEQSPGKGPLEASEILTKLRQEKECKHVVLLSWGCLSHTCQGRRSLRNVVVDTTQPDQEDWKLCMVQLHRPAKFKHHGKESGRHEGLWC